MLIDQRHNDVLVSKELFSFLVDTSVINQYSNYCTINVFYALLGCDFDQKFGAPYKDYRVLCYASYG